MGVIDSSIDKRATPWLEFVGENRVSGFSGCNMMNGSWRMEGDAVKLGPLMATKRGCMGPEGDLEKRVLAALAEQGRGTREGSKLVFTAPGGQRFEFVLAK
jgi:heat shock protein HslJ